ncbi:cytochrome c1 [Rhodopila sp.]|jgi:ubiquinol-cytochrome c reductase cytochrome c1 subunit|uniref:cytochrome c1 n=1 Tax=Rhodopila sp. TaxID=2480087 RepID=UPI002BCC0B68|nr:cytochrome c1 [Rhodopila sp.]HVZ08756.1 cytochrome c1 [Rhodopila sp.]
MMRTPRSLLGGLVALLHAAAPLAVAPVAVVSLAIAPLAIAPLAIAPSAAQAAEESVTLPNERWSFEGPLGAFDLAAAQRGFQVYSQVCSNCHSMQYMHFRMLSGIGLNPEQIKAVAATFTVPLGLNDEGQPKEGPGLPSSQFRSPFPNAIAAAAANNGAVPPDLSLIVNAREGGPNYVYGILTGYTNPPAGVTVADGTFYNRVFPGHQIKMPQPLQDGTVTYTDGTPNNLNQEAHDVVTFLSWAANPEIVERKQMGVKAILFLLFMTGVTYAVKRKVWSDVH